MLRQGRWIAGDKARAIMFAFDKVSFLLCLVGGIHQVLSDGKPEELQVPSCRHERWSQELLAALSVALQKVVILQLSGRSNESSPSIAVYEGIHLLDYHCRVSLTWC